MLLQLVEAILANISVAESIDDNILHITFIRKEPILSQIMKWDRAVIYVEVQNI